MRQAQLIAPRQQSLFDLPVPDTSHAVKRARSRNQRLGASLSLELLNLPLFFGFEPSEYALEAVITDAELERLEAEELLERELEALGEETDPLMSRTFSLGAILDMHSVLLMTSLGVLAGRGNAKQKHEVLDWVFEPDFVGEVMVARDGEMVARPVYSIQVPFSFALCCKIEGMRHDRMRDGLVGRLPDLAKRYYY